MLQVSKGNLDLLRILFDRYHVRIFNFFFKMNRNKDMSEDLTQDVFLKIIKYRTSYNSGNFTAWIFTIARNIFATQYQKIKKERSSEIDEDKIANESSDFEESTRNEEIIHLQKALLKLKKSERELIVMHRYQEIKYEQIAQIIGSSEGAVKVKVHRALKKLKELYFLNI